MGKAADLVRSGLKEYADRGIFRSFAEEKGKGKLIFSFVLYEPDTLTVEFSEKEHTLVVRNLLKQVDADMYKELQDFLKKLYDPDLPSHRRIDKTMADAKFTRKTGNLSLVFKVKKNRYEDGVKMLISLLGWLRFHLQKWYSKYLYEMGAEQEG